MNSETPKMSPSRCMHKNVLYVRVHQHDVWFADAKTNAICKNCGTRLQAFSGFIEQSPPPSPILNSPTIKI